MQATHVEQTGQLVLADNFRLTRNLVDLINLVFTKLIQRESDHVGPYEPLVWGLNYPFEGQAIVETESDREQIMTIHASKELGFQIVFLVHLDRCSRPEVEQYLDPEYGVGFNVANDDSKSDLVLTDGACPAILGLM